MPRPTPVPTLEAFEPDHRRLQMLLLGLVPAGDLLGVPAPAPRPAEPRQTQPPTLAANMAQQMPLLRREAPSVFQVTRFRWRVRERHNDRLCHAARTLLTAQVPDFCTVTPPDRLALLHPAVRIGGDALVLPLRRAWQHGRGART